MVNKTRPVFHRIGGGALVKPRADKTWEAGGAFAPAVMKAQDEYWMMYRAFGRDKISRLAIATSNDGLSWKVPDEPQLVPSDDQEAWGIEDPRAVMLDNNYMVTYTAANGHTEADGWHWTTRVRFARSTDGQSFVRISPALPELDNKDAVLFPEKINGYYWLMHRFMPDIWVSRSKDLIQWEGHRRIVEPVPHSWQSLRIGAGAPPILTHLGWLIFHHGVSIDLTYSMSAFILDADDPTRVLYRMPYPLMVPEEPYELTGYVPNVIFGTSITDEGETWRMYYGGADFVIAAAEINKADLLAAIVDYPAESASDIAVPARMAAIPAEPEKPLVTVEDPDIHEAAHAPVSKV